MAMSKGAKTALYVGIGVVVVAAAVLLVLFAGKKEKESEKVEETVKEEFVRISGTMTYAIIETEKGTMKAELYMDETPGTAGNFVKLANDGFYDGLNFHRVIPDFVIQGGCPNGIGNGGPGYTIKCETDAPRQYHDRGVLSMAHAGKDTGGSQFFICHGRQNTQHLDGVHTCFGKVVEGEEVIDDIRQGDKIVKISIVQE
jgi:Peptidyl-prolyl cis-trans isomerase (rotamase) - cyclophilin family